MLEIVHGKRLEGLAGLVNAFGNICCFVTIKVYAHMYDMCTYIV